MNVRGIGGRQDKNMVSSFKYAAIFISVLLVGLVGFVFWPAKHTPTPTTSECLSLEEGAGKLVPLAVNRNQLYGVALTYSGIIRQGGYDYDPLKSPPVFRKLTPAFDMGHEVKYTTQHEILEMNEKNMRMVTTGVSRT